MTAAIDITAGQRKTLLALLRRYIPGVAVWAYGSRVKWTARPNSDLDLVAFTTPEQQPLVSELKEALAESDLPFLVDFHVWDDVPERFHEIIRKEYVVLQEAKTPEVVSGLAGNGVPLTLGDVVTLQRGTTYKSALLGQPGPVLLGLASIQRNGGFRDDSLKTYGGESPEKLTLRPGDIYVSLKDVTQSADLLGAVARVPPHVHAGRVTQDTVKLSFIKKDVPSCYLYWLLRTPAYREYCRAHAIGTTNLSLARDDFLAFPVPRPKARELTLVETLDALDSKIELNRRMNATLEAMARALFQSWFVDFDPVRAKLDSREPAGLDAATTALFPAHFQESPLGHIPQGWSAGTLSEGFDLTMGQSPPGDTYNEDGDGIPFYQGRTDFGFRFPTRRIYCTAPTRYAKPGDTLVSVRAPVGDINMADEECCIGRGVAAVRHKSGAVSFTYHAMENLSPDFALFEGEGTVFGSINKQSFENLRFVIPPQEIVAAYEQIAKPLDDQIYTLEHQSRSLAALRDSLLPKLLSGELSVTEIP